MIVSDLHLKNKDQFDTKKDFFMSSRTYSKITKLEKIIKQEEPDILIDCGDLFDTAEPNEFVRTLYFSTITKLVKKIFIIAGNHNSEKGLMTGTSEAFLTSNVKVIQPGKVEVFDQFTMIGYTRSKEKFMTMCNENKNNYLFTHRDIPEQSLPFEKCFFGHVHAHYEKANCISVGSLFKDSWSEENEDNCYAIVDDKVRFIKYEDLNIKTFNSVEERELDQTEYDFIRFKFKGKADILKGINEKELREKYHTKFFEYDIEKESIVKEKVDDINSAITEFIKSKNLSERELEFGRRFNATN
jgi:DNA repair exonuclease SbcCD nuclease subunit